MVNTARDVRAAMLGRLRELEEEELRAQAAKVHQLHAHDIRAQRAQVVKSTVASLAMLGDATVQFAADITRAGAVRDVSRRITVNSAVASIASALAVTSSRGVADAVQPSLMTRCDRELTARLTSSARAAISIDAVLHERQEKCSVVAHEALQEMERRRPSSAGHTASQLASRAKLKLLQMMNESPQAAANAARPQTAASYVRYGGQRPSTTAHKARLLTFSNKEAATHAVRGLKDDAETLVRFALEASLSGWVQRQMREGKNAATLHPISMKGKERLMVVQAKLFRAQGLSWQAQSPHTSARAAEVGSLALKKRARHRAYVAAMAARLQELELEVESGAPAQSKLQLAARQPQGPQTLDQQARSLTFAACEVGQEWRRFHYEALEPLQGELSAARALLTRVPGGDEWSQLLEKDMLASSLGQLHRSAADNATQLELSASQCKIYDLAATTIQKLWRGILGRREKKRLVCARVATILALQEQEAATLIQRAFRRHRRHAVSLWKLMNTPANEALPGTSNGDVGR